MIDITRVDERFAHLRDTPIGAHFARLARNTRPDAREDTLELLDSLQNLIRAQEDSSGEFWADTRERLIAYLAFVFPDRPVQEEAHYFLTSGLA